MKTIDPKGPITIQVGDTPPPRHHSYCHGCSHGC